MSTPLHYVTIRELATLLRRRETSPTELTHLALERLSTVGQRLNAVVTLTQERALREAQQAEAELRAGTDRGPLHGIPYGVKDLLAAQGYPTTWGATPYRGQVFPDDAAVVQRLHAAGAILVAKLAMTELAGAMGDRQPHNTFTGPCQTPWSAQHWSGGSSSGSAAAVASGCVPFAIGSETGGSIIIPAAFCGVSGLRPTFGRVSRTGSMVASWTLDKLGPLCRSADDCGLVLQAIAGHDPRDPDTLMTPFSYPDGPSASGEFRFGVLAFSGVPVDPDIQHNFDATIDELRDLGTLETVELPDFPYTEVFSTIAHGEVSSAFYELLVTGDVRQLTAPEDRVNGLHGLGIPTHVYLRARRIQFVLSDALADLTRRYDALLAPPVKYTATSFDHNREPGSLQLPHGIAGNVAGLPAIAVPNGFTEQGLPTSLSMLGSPNSETTLIQIASAFQRRTDWHLRYPPL